VRRGDDLDEAVVRIAGAAAALAALAALAIVSAPLGAQRGTGRIEGEVVDSMHVRPLSGAMVLVTRLAPEPAVWFGAVTDSRGRFRLDTLPAGRYTVVLAHPLLDSLELTLPPKELELADGGRAQVALALPSGATLRRLACPGVTLPPGTGVLLGQVTDADAEQPLVDAVVAVSWSDLVVDRATLRAEQATRAEGVRTGPLGLYRLCGVPTDSWLAVQVQRAGRAGSVLQTMVPDTAGVATLNVSVSAAAMRALPPLDSATADTATRPLLSGSASVAGSVLDAAGRPLPGAQVRVLETVGSTRADSAGRFLLTGLPAGTQVLESKRVGYRIVQQPVQLRAARRAEVEVRLARIVSLDSIRIVAQRSRYREFEQRRRGGFGRYFGEEDIERRRPFDVSDLVRDLPGFRVVGFGADATVSSTRATTSEWGVPCRGANIVIDGMQHQEINWLRPEQVGAIEVYSSTAGAPAQYDRRCGLVVIWTKR
jgi:Carboxypeptidase regulatory-like domain/TonB-dependent Receptor Plug Domain